MHGESDHHPQCYRPGPSRHHLQPVFLPSPLNWPPYLYPCPPPVRYSERGSLRDVFKYKLCLVTPQLKTLQYPSLTLRIKSILWPRSLYLTWGLPTSATSPSYILPPVHSFPCTLTSALPWQLLFPHLESLFFQIVTWLSPSLHPGL